MSARFEMKDYIDVAERVREFYAKYPTGSLRCGSPPQVFEIAGKFFIAYHAQAFRAPDDPCPSDGWAWEPVPGPTPYTKDSELQNAETSAWGRAIVALGFETKHIASAQEVRNRSGAGDTSSGRENPAATPRIEAGSTPAPEPSAGESGGLATDGGAAPTKPSPSSPAVDNGRASPAKLAYITALISDLAKLRKTTQKAVKEALANDGYDLAALGEAQAEELVGKLERWKGHLEALHP